MENKIIPRVAYYSQPEKRKPKLQISDTSSQSWITKEKQDVRNEILECNLDPAVTEEGQKQLRGFRYFIQWSAAVNFDFCSFNRTYENITIDEKFQMNYEKEPCEIDFTNLLDMWKYINDIQQTGNWTCQKNRVKTIQSFFNQFNLDIFREIMTRPWFEAKKDLM
jgi:hypothetical protein